MKRTIGWVMLLVLGLLACCVNGALAEGDVGVQIIGEPPAETNQFVLDDFKKGDSVTIDGYGIITGRSFDKYGSDDYTEYIFSIEFLNLTQKPVKFMENIAVSIVFEDTTPYVYNGSFYQIDDNGYRHESAEYEKAIEPYCYSYYYFTSNGRTIPNYVANTSKLPLRMEIKFGDFEITYNIRK